LFSLDVGLVKVRADRGYRPTEAQAEKGAGDKGAGPGEYESPGPAVDHRRWRPTISRVVRWLSPHASPGGSSRQAHWSRTRFASDPAPVSGGVVRVLRRCDDSPQVVWHKKFRLYRRVGPDTPVGIQEWRVGTPQTASHLAVGRV